MNELMKINETEILSLRAETEVLLKSDAFLNLKIDSDEAVESASQYLSKIAKATKQIEKKRKEITAPYVDWKRETDKFFKETVRPLKEADALVRNKILAWRKTENVRIFKEEERRRKIQEAHAKKGHKVNAPVEMMKTEQTIGKSTAQKYWVFSVTDPTKIPLIFMQVDQMAVKAAIKSGERKIPGLRIYQEERLRIN